MRHLLQKRYTFKIMDIVQFSNLYVPVSVNDLNKIFLLSTGLILLRLNKTIVAKLEVVSVAL